MGTQMGKRNQEQDEKIVQDLPEMFMILVKDDVSPIHHQIINLDQYTEKEGRINILKKVIDKYGAERVRYCKVLSTVVRTTVEVSED